jgi:hypothetical protein
LRWCGGRRSVRVKQGAGAWLCLRDRRRVQGRRAETGRSAYALAGRRRRTWLLNAALGPPAILRSRWGAAAGPAASTPCAAGTAVLACLLPGFGKGRVSTAEAGTSSKLEIAMADTDGRQSNREPWSKSGRHSDLSGIGTSYLYPKACHPTPRENPKRRCLALIRKPAIPHLGKTPNRRCLVLVLEKAEFNQPRNVQNRATSAARPLHCARCKRAVT